LPYARAALLLDAAVEGDAVLDAEALRGLLERRRWSPPPTMSNVMFGSSGASFAIAASVTPRRASRW
jgi:hypothetical protein